MQRSATVRAELDRLRQRSSIQGATLTKELADLLTLAGDFAEARRLYGESIATLDRILALGSGASRPEDFLLLARALHNRGSLSRQEGDGPGGIADYIEAAERAPDSAFRARVHLSHADLLISSLKHRAEGRAMVDAVGREARGVDPDVGTRVALLEITAELARLEGEVGDAGTLIGEAEQTLKKFLAKPHGTTWDPLVGHLLPMNRVRAGQLDLQLGHRDRAVELVTHAHRELSAGGYRALAIHAGLVRAAAERAVGNATGSLETLEMLRSELDAVPSMDRRTRSGIERLTGSWHHAKGDLSRAALHHRRSLDVLQPPCPANEEEGKAPHYRASDWTAEARAAALRDLAADHLAVRSPRYSRRAAILQDEALAILQAAGADKLEMARLTTNRALALTSAGEIEPALSSLAEAEAVFSAAGSWLDLAAVAHNRAAVLAVRGDDQSLRDALDALIPAALMRDLARVDLQQPSSRRAQWEHETRASVESALRIADRLGDSRLVVELTVTFRLATVLPGADDSRPSTLSTTGIVSTPILLEEGDLIARVGEGGPRPVRDSLLRDDDLLDVRPGVTPGITIGGRRALERYVTRAHSVYPPLRAAAGRPTVAVA
ncbi:MAG: hypothetical protein RJQ01_10195 [Microcella sp.]